MRIRISGVHVHRHKSVIWRLIPYHMLHIDIEGNLYWYPTMKHTGTGYFSKGAAVVGFFLL